MATPTTHTAEPGTTSSEGCSCLGRRTVVAAGGAALAGVVLAACSGPGGTTATTAPSAAPSPSGAAAADGAIAALDAIAVGSAIAVTGPDGSPALLVRTTADDVIGLSAACPHKGCTVVPEDGGLICPCHASTFTLEGAVTKGPADSDLPSFPVAVRDGQVFFA